MRYIGIDNIINELNIINLVVVYYFIIRWVNVIVFEFILGLNNNFKLKKFVDVEV